jgi:hypothetical protein
MKAVVLLAVLGLPVRPNETRLPRARIQPSLVRLAPGGQQQFRVSTIRARLEAATLVENVRWTVNGVAGGNGEVGTINVAGLYRAPARPPSPPEVHIGAEAEGMANRYLWATVLVGDRPPSYRLLRQWGESADRLNRLKSPHGISVEPDGNLLLADEGSGRVLRYSPEGALLAEIGHGPGRENGQFTKPRYALADADGRIFVSDEKSDRPRLQIFSAEGEFLRILAEKGTGPGMLLRAHGMQFDSHGRLFVVDVDNARVNVYECSGKFLYAWGKDGLLPGELNAAHGLVVDPSGDVFLCGYYGPASKYDPQGSFLFAFNHAEPPDGPMYFHSIGGDRWGNVYVAVRNLGGRRAPVSVLKYNNNGDYITGWRLSSLDHDVNWVAVDRRDTAYVLFEGPSRVGVELFRPE